MASCEAARIDGGFDVRLSWPACFTRQCTDGADSARPEEPEFSNQDWDGNWASLKIVPIQYTVGEGGGREKRHVFP
ncbi:hypothetical protein CFB47_23635 [Burkholderia sp. AU27893]|uniref:Uncharacterized protein n=1 Tax=Burkholderia contaminans TaxID=488447 RepID=A0A2S5E791_9BURK|nr:hypothetical protein CFB47_23635 [Burkholderia sp. AU27893]POZ87251.1 hypothetical protein C3743_12690 [Burkholderia contaminans]